MITVLLIAAAVAALGGPQLLEQGRQLVGHVNLPALDRRHVIGAALLAAAAWHWSSTRPSVPTPAPAPEPAALVLRGKFVGPDAAADAATTAALLDELASEIEWDGMQREPLLKTGVSFDDLRTRARALRTRGVSLGEKHPRAREEIKAYLDKTAGTSGGPVTPEGRAAWIAAYREIARAAADAAR